MSGAVSRAAGLVLAAGLVIVPALLTMTGTATATQAQYDRAYRIGLEAYTYGLPLLQTNVTFRTMTSIDVTRRAYGPVNQSLQGFLVPNPIKRYQFNDKSKLTRNPDGSVGIYLQSTEPTDPAQAANWLPTPAGQGFEVIWRLLAPKPGRIQGILDGSGWQPPAITPTL